MQCICGGDLGSVGGSEICEKDGICSSRIELNVDCVSV